MNSKHTIYDRPYDKPSSFNIIDNLRTASFLGVLAALLLFSFGCSDNLTNCIEQSIICQDGCPSEEQAQAAIAQAEQDRSECLDGCPRIDINSTSAEIEAWGRCTESCLDAYDLAVAAATECNDICDEEFAECTDMVCDDPTSTAYLLEVDVADWSQHVSRPLIQSSHAVLVCQDHFAHGTDSGEEVIAALEEMSRVTDASVDFYPAWRAHQDKSGIFVDPPSSSVFDYVDNANDPFPHACHPDNCTNCFAMNTCKYTDEWNGSGDTEEFAVTANASNYGHFLNPSSSDHPWRDNIQHEFGHVVGMKHTPKYWPEEDKQYTSVIQGNLLYLSAYDAAFLREFYPDPSGVLSRDFVASSKIRLDFGGPNEVSGKFSEKNPDRIYLDGDGVFDCDTQEKAVFYAAWFNTGTGDQLSDHCMVNELRIEDDTTYREVSLNRWQAATMPAESQDHWTGVADVTASDFANLPFGTHDLVFEVNVYEQWRERSDNNVVKAPITFYTSSTCNSFGAPPPPLPSIQQVGPRTYKFDRGLVTDVVASPGRLFRGAELAPRRVGKTGIGFKILRLKTDSLAAASGAKEGDILWRVDGNPITGEATAFGAVQTLLTTGEVRLVILRDKSFLQFAYRLR
jgi:hypothetical protein